MSWRPRTAMVLAAGLGTRMRPLTDEVPKPMVRLAGRPLIEHVLDRLERAGIERAVVNVHYRPEPLLAWLETRSVPRILLSDERAELLDTGGGVKRALKALGPEPFIVHNSDTVWSEGAEANLDRLIRAWDSERMDCLLLLAATVSSIGYDGHGDFFLGGDGRLRRRRERELSPFVFAGVSIAHPRLFEAAPEGPFSLNLLWDRAAEKGRLHGVRLEGTWMHVGTPEALREAEGLIGRG